MRLVKYLLLIGLLLQLVVIPIRVDSLQFILCSLFPFLYFSAHFIAPKYFPVKVVATDLGWLVFSIWSGFSFIWSVDGSLVWYPTFGWLVMIFWMMLIRSVYLEKDSLNTITKGCTYLFLGILLLYLLYLSVRWYRPILLLDTSQGYLKKIAPLVGLPLKQIWINTRLPEFWNTIFGYNCNVTALSFIALYPFILFSANSSKRYAVFKVICTLCVGSLLYEASSIGVVIIFLVLLFFYAWSHYSFQRLSIASTTVGVVILSVAGLYLYDSTFFSSSTIVKEVFSFRDGGRYFMILDSLYIFLENPIIGIGQGNWSLFAYQYDLSNTEYVSNHASLKLENHVIYSRILSELGLVGFVLFVGTIFFLIYSRWKIDRVWSSIELAAFCSLLVYLMAMLFYAGAILKPFFFCKVQLVGFCAMGILSMRQPTLTFSKWLLPVLLIGSMTSAAWFLYTFKTYRILAQAKRIMNEQPKKAFNQIESAYHPIFMTSDGRNNSISLSLAYLAVRQQNYEQAQDYLKQSLVLAPTNEQVLLANAQYQLRKEKNFVLAENLMNQTVFSISNQYYAELLSAEIFITKKEFSKARKVLNQIDFPDRYTTWIKLLKWQLYLQSNFQERLFLTTNQKTILNQSVFFQQEHQENIQRDLEQVTYNIYATEKKAKEQLSKNVERQLLAFDNLLLQTFPEEQFILYLEDRYKSRLTNIVAKFSDQLNLSPQQIKILHTFLNKQLFERRKLSLMLNQTNKNKEEETRRQMIKAIQTTYYDSKMEFQKLFTKEQYLKYQSTPALNANSVDKYLFE